MEGHWILYNTTKPKEIPVIFSTFCLSQIPIISCTLRNQRDGCMQILASYLLETRRLGHTSKITPWGAVKFAEHDIILLIAYVLLSFRINFFANRTTLHLAHTISLPTCKNHAIHRTTFVLGVEQYRKHSSFWEYRHCACIIHPGCSSHLHLEIQIVGWQARPRDSIGAATQCCKAECYTAQICHVTKVSRHMPQNWSRSH